MEWESGFTFWRDNLPAVVLLACKFLYVFPSSHMNTDVPQCWIDPYEFVVLLTSFSTWAHVVNKSDTALPLIAILVPLFNNSL